MKPAIAFALMLAAAPVWAATGTDPDWPCIQRKQPHLSLGQVWTGPVPDERVADLARDPKIEALAARLEQRRLPLEEAEAAIAEFAKDADDAHLTALMVAIMDKIEPDRAALIAGIARYGHSQVDLARRIEERRARMVEMEQADPPDFDAIDAAEEALDWDQRVFTERQQSLTYVCETPVILEQRAFALGRAIAGHLED
ncbi:hypothetical protein PARHAE_00898 [Paracoccus haematequi]|uniref:Uncharacterized protein n=1 Tax=Paracoccus haematequi TaxID=2491866 RepID=A0A3S4CI82_9RHOB|nr:hypothetical protein [Paracoccus haematequi]VDS07720.1 hypothetical protein PARHAE_00898 [Paracoccus haematequi]